MKTLEQIKNECVSNTFIEQMTNAMCMSYFKYGNVNDKAGECAMDKLKKELNMFMKDHNLEHMVNIANYAMIRYMRPMEGESYRGTDSNMSVVSKGKRQCVFDWLREYILEND